MDPTKYPTEIPTDSPTLLPSDTPTLIPTKSTILPSKNPTDIPTDIPSILPTNDPSMTPTYDPTMEPTINPTSSPSFSPSFDPIRDVRHNPAINSFVLVTVPVMISTILLICIILLYCFFQYYRRSKKQELSLATKIHRKPIPSGSAVTNNPVILKYSRTSSIKKDPKIPQIPQLNDTIEMNNGEQNNNNDIDSDIEMSDVNTLQEGMSILDATKANNNTTKDTIVPSKFIPNDFENEYD